MAPSKITCILLAGLVIGCGQARNRVGINPPPPITGKLYVTNASTNAILRFDNAFTATGNMAPAATISGPATTLSNPRYIFCDTANDRLFVANNGGSSILIFDALSTKNGNVAPTRFIAGAGTSLATPVDVALDKTRDLLYVADGSSILVFATASTINGAIPPARTLSPGFTARAILLDSANDRLFLADSAGNAIDVYDNVSTLTTGVITANRIIVGAGTGLHQPAGLFIDTAGRLIVSNFSPPSITVYSGAATSTGNVAPAATISGATTTLAGPTQIVLLTANSANDLYVADGLAGGSVPAFTNMATANGNIAPGRDIVGANTGLARSGGGTGPATATGIALDSTR